jgi:hypothetical protein
MLGGGPCELPWQSFGCGFISRGVKVCSPLITPNADSERPRIGSARWIAARRLSAFALSQPADLGPEAGGSDHREQGWLAECCQPVSATSVPLAGNLEDQPKQWSGLDGAGRPYVPGRLAWPWLPGTVTAVTCASGMPGYALAPEHGRMAAFASTCAIVPPSRPAGDRMRCLGGWVRPGGAG